MDNLQGENRSFWRVTEHGVSYPKLAQDIEVDTAVIGGGISGILTAYFLAKRGKSVALLEARELVGGTTGGTTAKLSSQHELIYDKMIQLGGVELAKQYYEANQTGLRLIEELVTEHVIDCGFQEMDSYVISQHGTNTQNLEKEAAAYEKIGIEGGMTDSVPLEFNVASALVMKDQAQIHPVKFLHGVVREIDQMGGHIYQHTKYMGTERNGGQLTLQTDSPFTVTCRQVVLATLFPVEDPHSFYSNTMKPVTSHLTAFESPHTFVRGVYISDDTPKRTFRGAQDGNRHVLIVGGETHPTGDANSTVERYKAIRQFAKEEFGLTEMIGYWSEHELTTPDKRPYIGPIEEGDDQMYVMTGYNKWGMTAAAAGAQLIADLITGENNRFEELFSPQRSLPEKNNDDSGQSNDAFKSLLQRAERLEKGQADQFKQNGKPIGIYKDINANVHYLDLHCTHLGCGVRWNDGDQTWDCPCHGSIFDGTGEVLAGPAKQPLKKVNPY